MTERSDPSIQSKTLDEYVLDVFTFDRVEVSVESTFSDDDDGLAFAYHPVLRESNM